ncbi:EF-hand domain pair [Plasmopara halstedii]|uniref:EF-hand domain pair n=1 Tax=Plasmopara halstedii TaxID=4781 RepID=A0A0P1A752_PLAHL|nr:EF-hand domain pair [Plasmopara halstedii]CEG36302.1 EF-hand domain pair [Plasmopara halstedii]|eukprot:XP_024572671.1 EF-hand domain pair [Plasmopara halstedii]
MDAVNHARALNGLLTLSRLERMRHVYHTWVNVKGVEEGMALTRRELQCILESSELGDQVNFLFDRFRCVSTRKKHTDAPCVDLMTILITMTLLAQGALTEKARFVFQLVDLDTEDDIVEAELALVISTCCNGLHRLGIIENRDTMSELDAMAVAYEAFDFVDLEDGDKMSFELFLKWLRCSRYNSGRLYDTIVEAAI